mgnify:CR=1 FL=1|tara:strand:- start:3573 stop:3818 length:246 start_codon:yes stop_codon:yes gene_type:complete
MINYDKIDLAKLQTTINLLREQRDTAMDEYVLLMNNKMYYQASMKTATSEEMDRRRHVLQNVHDIAASRQLKPISEIVRKM